MSQTKADVWPSHRVPSGDRHSRVSDKHVTSSQLRTSFSSDGSSQSVENSTPLLPLNLSTIEEVAIETRALSLDGKQ